MQPSAEMDIPEKSEMMGMLVHITEDIHDLSERIARIEAMAEEFAPAGRAWLSLAGLRRRGRGDG